MSQQLTLEEIQNFKGKYPKQLWYLFMTEMWERFCFYGGRGMLTVFMITQLMIDEKSANLQYGAIQAFIYAFTFIGGLFADKILGFRKSLFWGGILMVAGSFIIAISPKEFFYIGTCFTIVGTGFFKPNISTMVGDLYHAGDTRRDAGFGLFYSGINLGALLGGIVCVWLGKYYSWSWAFASAGIVMVAGLITFVFTQRSLGPIGLSPLKDVPKGKRTMMEVATYVGSLVVLPLILTMVRKTEYTDYFMYTIGPLTLVYIFYEMAKMNAEERNKMLAAVIFSIFSILFWAFFEQSGGSLSIFALNHLEDNFLGIKLDPNVVNNSANSVFVIIFSVVAGLVWLWLAKRNKEPNSVIKFALSFLFLGLGFFIFYSSRFFADGDARTPQSLFILAWLVLTFAELCLSPIGLSLMTKLAPKRLWGVMMGLWFLASAYGQYVAGLLGAGMSNTNENASAMDKLVSYTDGYKQLGIYGLIAGVVLIVLSPVVRKMMHNVK